MCSATYGEADAAPDAQTDLHMSLRISQQPAIRWLSLFRQCLYILEHELDTSSCYRLAGIHMKAPVGWLWWPFQG